MRVVIDTNLLVSAVIRDRLPERVLLWCLGQSDIRVVGDTRDHGRIQRGHPAPEIRLPRATINWWLELLAADTRMIEARDKIDFPRDRKDAPFLMCAASGEADYLITGGWRLQRGTGADRDAHSERPRFRAGGCSANVGRARRLAPALPVSSAWFRLRPHHPSTHLTHPRRFHQKIRQRPCLQIQGQCGLARPRVLAGGSPARVIVSREPGIKPCGAKGN